jgi:exopolyphosphatase/guanosine-5'-triphosphate,3'-diphosphate pyrophosphatase
MRVAVVDIGTNSTRLLVADVASGGAVTELDRRTTVTRLGQGVDASGVLAPEAMERVFATLAGYREAMDGLEVEGTTAVLTSAVPRRGERRGVHRPRARRVPPRGGHPLGRRGGRASFLGATSARPADAPRPSWSSTSAAGRRSSSSAPGAR